MNAEPKTPGESDHPLEGWPLDVFVTDPALHWITTIPLEPFKSWPG